MAVDKLPAELPIEATNFFGNSLLPYVPMLAKADFSKPIEQIDLHPDFQKAVIVHQGKLTPKFEYLQKYL